MTTTLTMGRATREAYGDTLAALGAEYPNLVVLDADLSKSTYTNRFAKKFPDRFFNLGIAESNLVGVAAGLALSGKVPFVSSFAAFLLCNAYDQIRVSVAYAGADVKFVGSHGGISIGEDGVSQMAIEDVALATALPGFIVMVPADEVSTAEAVKAAAAHHGPVYIRVGRPKVPILYPDGCPFTIGRANRLRQGGDVTIIANGLMVAAALQAAEHLAGEGIEARVLDMHTVKPLDDEAVARAAVETGAIVVAEEHLLDGGLGSHVAVSVARQHPCPLEFVTMPDTYAESGTPDELLQKYGLTARAVVLAAERAVRRKQA